MVIILMLFVATTDKLIFITPHQRLSDFFHPAHHWIQDFFHPPKKNIWPSILEIMIAPWL